MCQDKFISEILNYTPGSPVICKNNSFLALLVENPLQNTGLETGKTYTLT